MKRPATEVKYPHAANLFQFCKKILDQKFGGIRIIDQDVGQILGFDPADCSHWKKGKKNVRSIQSIKAIADHLGVNEQLVIDVASGDIDDKEGFYEFTGYGDFEVEQKLFEASRKELFRKNPTFWTKDREFELKNHCEQTTKKIETLVSDIHKKINFLEAPLYPPELVNHYPNLKISHYDTETETLVKAEQSGANFTLYLPKQAENRPYVRFEFAKNLADFFLKDLLQETTAQYPEVAPKLIDIFRNVFAANVLVPVTLLRKEIQNVNVSKDIIAQLADTFWVSRTFMNKRLKEVLR